MNSQKPEHQKKNKEDEVYDPDPLTIALSIIQTITPIGSLLAEQHISSYKEEKKRKIAIRNALYDSYRAVNESERLLKDFVSFLDQQGLLDREFRMGKAPIFGVPILISQIKALHKDSYTASKKLSDAMIELSKLLDQEDFLKCASFAERLNQHLSSALTAKNYKAYALAASKFISQAQNLITSVGEKYEFQPSSLS